MSQGLRILYAGEMRANSKSRMMANVFKALGHQVDVVNIYGADFLKNNKTLPLWARAYSKATRLFDYWPDFGDFNKRLLDKIQNHEYDIFWVTKSPCLRPDVLSRLASQHPQCKRVYFTTDDLLNKSHSSATLRKTWPLFDVVISTNPLNHEAEDQKRLGLNNTLWENFFFDENLHSRQVLTESEKELYDVDVVFVGSFEEERASSLLALARAGVVVRVWGNFWPPNWKRKHPNLQIQFQDLAITEYVKALSGAKICLGFLRKANRDQVTGRSVEIPGVGGFLLTERTPIHLSMYVENEEAAFFSGDAELVEKVKYYLKEEALREQIAAKGHQKVHEHGYSFQKRLPKILERISN